MRAKDSVCIGKREVGPKELPLIIAEMSGNHNQSLDRALALVDAAADAGAHALKLQTYTADTMTLDVDSEDFLVTAEDNPWTGRRLYELYQEAHTPWDWHAPIFKRACDKGLIAFSTPFDETAVDFLEELGTPAYKIASFENNHLPLIRRVAATRKPLILSTGMATLAEIEAAVQAARQAGCQDLLLLKCTSSYPATADHSDLATISHMRDLFNCPVGLSDHTLGIGVPVAAVALGACVVEKHFTLDRADGGVDADFSLEPAELRTLVTETERAWRGVGRIRYGPRTPESGSRSFRRSLYFSRNCDMGHVVTSDDIRIVRPGYGLAPAFLDHVIGMRLTKSVRRGDRVDWLQFRQEGEQEV